MKKAWLILIVVVLILAAVAVILLTVGAGKYSSHYNAVGYVHSSSAQSAKMSFSSLKGTQTFKLKSDKEAHVRYSAELETGNVTVSYDCGDGKTELCTLNAGDETESTLEELKPGTVYVIVEADGHCEDGDFHFDIQ